VAENSFDFMLGPYMLIASIYKEGNFTFSLNSPIEIIIIVGAKTRSVYLPANQHIKNWYDWHTGKVYSGGHTVQVETSLDTIPVFIAEGAIIPAGKVIMLPSFLFCPVFSSISLFKKR